MMPQGPEVSMEQTSGQLGNPAMIQPLSMEEQNLLLKREAQNALMQLRSNQMQEELGAIAKERQAEIAKELNQLDKDNKMPGKQRDENELDPNILSDIAMMRMNAVQQQPPV